MNEGSDSKFVTTKWNIVNNQSYTNHDVGNEIIYNTEVLKSNLYDYNDAFILVSGDITDAAVHETQIVFKNCVSFATCITKIDGTIIGDAEDQNLVMPMHNSLEYNSNYSDTIGSLWFYSKDDATNCNANIVNINNFKSFTYKAKLLKDAVAQPAPKSKNC